jgi:Phage integrase family
LGNDRAPAIDKIRTLIDYPDRRIKPIVYTMVSSGIRLGAWDYLRWGDIEPIMQDEKVVAAKMVVYRGDAEEYITFMAPEAYHALKDWMHHREMSGEKVTKNSWVMRNLWNVEHYHHGFVTKPTKLKSSGIKRLIERALWAQGLRKPLEDGKRRHEFKADHGFRKYFKTRAEQVMRPANVELLMGHNIGLSTSYHKPTEREVLQDYLRAAELLTIDNTESRAKADSEVLAKLHDRDELYSMVVDIIAEVMEKNGGSKNS